MGVLRFLLQKDRNHADRNSGEKREFVPPIFLCSHTVTHSAQDRKKSGLAQASHPSFDNPGPCWRRWGMGNHVARVCIVVGIFDDDGGGAVGGTDRG